MKNDRLQDMELDRLDDELNRAEQAQLLQWETQDRGDALPEIASEPSMRIWRPSLFARIFRWRCWSKLSGWR
jgi:hypothetical protein